MKSKSSKKQHLPSPTKGELLVTQKLKLRSLRSHYRKLVKSVVANNLNAIIDEYARMYEAEMNEKEQIQLSRKA